MTEEESSSVFGAIGEAAEAAWDAQMNVAGAVGDAALGGAEFGAGVGAHALATGAELVGAVDTRDALDGMSSDLLGTAYDSWESAGEKVADAYTDIVGE
jgi:hypothetical protein